MEERLDDLWPPFAAGAARRRDEARPRRGRPAVLSRDEIVRAAIALADAEGAEAVNMRRIARELGAGTMSIYWHIADKEHLLDLMIDAVKGEEEVTDHPTGDWRQDLAHIARQERQSLLRHQWIVDFIGTRRPFGPNTLSHVEASLAALDDLDLDTKTALRILMTVGTYVTGSVLNELQELRSERTQTESGLDLAEIEAGMKEWRSRLERSGRFERVVRIFTESLDPDAGETRDERFEFGLSCVLAGIAAQLSHITARNEPR